MFSYMTHSRCLGYDRHHNRYWHMPELSANILVESGWAVPLPRHERKEIPSSAPIVSNFVYASDLSQLHYLRADGKHRKCDATMMSAPGKEVQWKMYAPDELIQLSASLNCLGIREKALRVQINKIKNMIKNTARPQPVFVEDAMEALKSCVRILASELEKAEFLTQELPEDWEAKLETATCSKLKSIMSTLFSLISKVMIKKEFSLADQTWKEIIGETNSISRLYYLCKMVDWSILWGTGLENEGCKACGKPQWLKSLRRCLGCGDVFHEGYCMAFYTNVCAPCAGCAGREKRTATNNVCYKEMDEEATSKSERGDENWLPMETDETGSVSGKRKLGSESDGERERVPNSRYQLRGVAGMEGALLDGLA
ncbi:tyrosine-protein kinase BAZ1B-like [Paramacrobiotus metropolitanus]|uniref:tyrosine-protein kinase BAZ1B-like n=1 Tax=Paramacrobiotus metropolitanus TaxID=2943436 RepID=UPI0024458793|nr:tyrosine-protein kinase BAZ1B-like [Paramacrobiotus metropolitanus]